MVQVRTITASAPIQFTACTRRLTPTPQADDAEGILTAVYARCTSCIVHLRPCTYNIKAHATDAHPIALRCSLIIDSAFVLFGTLSTTTPWLEFQSSTKSHSTPTVILANSNVPFSRFSLLRSRPSQNSPIDPRPESHLACRSQRGVRIQHIWETDSRLLAVDPAERSPRLHYPHTPHTKENTPTGSSISIRADVPKALAARTHFAVPPFGIDAPAAFASSTPPQGRLPIPTASCEDRAWCCTPSAHQGTRWLPLFDPSLCSHPLSVGASRRCLAATACMLAPAYAADSPVVSVQLNRAHICCQDTRPVAIHDPRHFLSSDIRLVTLPAVDKSGRMKFSERVTNMDARTGTRAGIPVTSRSTGKSCSPRHAGQGLLRSSCVPSRLCVCDISHDPGASGRCFPHLRSAASASLHAS